MLLATLIAVLGCLGGAAAADTDLDTDADRILRETSEFLQSAGEFRFRAEIAYDEIITTGEKIQYGGLVDIAVRRPDRLHVRLDSDERHMRVVYDGSTITLYDADKNLYAVSEAPAQIDAAGHVSKCV